MYDSTGPSTWYKKPYFLGVGPWTNIINIGISSTPSPPPSLLSLSLSLSLSVTHTHTHQAGEEGGYWTPLMAYTGRFRPFCFSSCRLQVYERAGFHELRYTYAKD